MPAGGVLRVSLFVSCLVDQLWPSVGVGAVRVLRRAGCDVHFERDQTCCGQPAHNSGYRDHARQVARHTIAVLERQPDAPIVCPSGSCTAMMRHYPELFEGDPAWCDRAAAVAARCYELSAFLVDRLGIDDVGARFAGRLTWHDACHGLRELAIREQPRRLLRKVAGAELVEARDCDACCGFGGTFAVKYPEISVAIADRKIEGIDTARVDAVVSSDVSCLMQIEGRLRRRGSPVRALHLAEVLGGEAER